MDISILSKEQRNRYKQVARVLVNHGLGFALPKLDVPWFKRILKKKYSRDVPLPKRLRSIMEELGPTFIKLGQFLSTRRDILPDEYADEFGKLVDEAPTFPYSKVQAIIEDEYDKEIEDVFREFDTKPSAAASIGQVHHAVLKSGEKVVVKVQRPGIWDTVGADIRILNQLAEFAHENIPEVRNYNLPGLVEEFRRTIEREMDYLKEARNTQRFRKAFKGNKSVVFPKVHMDLSTEKVIVTEFIDGSKPDKWIKKNPSKEARKKIAKLGSDVYLKQVFEAGMFQADPHPGNLLIIKDSRIGFVDFGMVGYIDEETQERLANIFMGIVKQDTDLMLKQILQIGAISGRIDRQRLRNDIARLVKQYYDVSLESFSVQELVNDIHHIMKDHDIVMPPNFALLLKTLMQIESLGRMIYPEYNFIEATRPFLKKLISRKKSLGSIKERMSEKLYEIVDLSSELPRRFDNLVWLLEHGSLRMEFEHKGLRGLLNSIHRSSNKLSISLVLASIIMASALLVNAGMEVLGMTGIVISGLLGIGWAIKLIFGK